jgi:hypothetical protein
MTGAMHIIRKDVRRLRPLLALWFAVVVVRVGLSLSGTAAVVESLSTDMLLQQLSEAIVMVELLLTALIVARLIHEEALVGLTAFWLTRPYERGTLLRAKLLFAILVLVAVPLLADLATMTLLGARTPALVRAGSTAMVGYLGGTLSLMVIATLTPSLAVFVLTLLGLVAGASMLLAATLGFAMFFAAEPSSYTPPAVPDATPGVVMMAVYVGAALSVVLYQYRHRRWRVATGLAVAGLTATVVVPMMWPWSFARGEEVRAGAWAAGAAAAHDPSWGTEVTDASRFGRGEPKRHVNARVTLSGVPAHMTVQRVGVRGRLRLTDGTTIESSQAGGGSSFRTATIEAALGGARLLQSRDVFEQGWTPMLTLAEPEFTRYAGGSGRLEADVHFELVSTQEAGVLPLTPGAALDDGVSRIEIVNVRRRTGGRDVTVRRWRADSPLSAERPPQERLFALRHRGRGEALMGGIDTTWATGRRSNAALALLRLPLGLSMSIHEGGEGGFSATTTFLRFPGPGFGKTPPLDAAWFDEAEFVMLETEWAGVVTRPLLIDEFPIPAN